MPAKVLAPDWSDAEHVALRDSPPSAATGRGDPCDDGGRAERVLGLGREDARGALAGVAPERNLVVASPPPSVRGVSVMARRLARASSRGGAVSGSAPGTPAGSRPGRLAHSLRQPANGRRAVPAQRWLCFVVLSIAAVGSAGGPRPVAAVRAVPGAPLLEQQRYTMNARVRPLLVWTRRDDVGEARITWRDDGRARRYELLVGSDPLKAPRRINKWGYIAEHISATEATIVGVMKEADGDSVEEAERELARERQGGYVFEGMHASVSGNQYTVRRVRIRSERDLTFRDLDALLAKLAAADAPARVAPVPQRAAPGFLSALAALLQETASASGGAGGIRLPPPLTYIHNGRLYDLRLRSAKPLADFIWSGRRYGPAIDGEFLITNRSTGGTTRFSIVYGRDGALAGVPLKIVFRPTWWFEAELVLEPEPVPPPRPPAGAGPSCSRAGA
jgi:hypothetical protein